MGTLSALQAPSDGNLRVTGGFLSQGTSRAKKTLDLCCYPKQTVEQTLEMAVISDDRCSLSLENILCMQGIMPSNFDAYRIHITATEMTSETPALITCMSSIQITGKGNLYYICELKSHNYLRIKSNND